jgi:hypothetical protein
LRLDFGPQWEQRKIITQQPPDVGTPFPVFVPQVDGDGNEIAGVRLPELTAPVATYTGWNLRDPKTGMPGERVSFIGSYLPFAKTNAERMRTGDPRPSLEERYRSCEEYLGSYAQAALALVEGRFLLPEDLADVLRRGVQEWDEVRASALFTARTSSTRAWVGEQSRLGSTKLPWHQRMLILCTECRLQLSRETYVIHHHRTCRETRHSPASR